MSSELLDHAQERLVTLREGEFYPLESIDILTNAIQYLIDHCRNIEDRAQPTTGRAEERMTLLEESHKADQTTIADLTAHNTDLEKRVTVLMDTLVNCELARSQAQTELEAERTKCKNLLLVNEAHIATRYAPTAKKARCVFNNQYYTVLGQGNYLTGDGSAFEAVVLQDDDKAISLIPFRTFQMENRLMQNRIVEIDGHNVVRPSGELYLLNPYVSWFIGDSTIGLDGNDFTATELRALADYMDSNNG